MGTHRKVSKAFIGNPWLLTFVEVQILVLLVDYSRKELTEMGHDYRVICTRVARMLPVFGSTNVTQMVVLFDRWWQNYQRQHVEDGNAERARERIFAPLSDSKEPVT